jgi:hypothetical protein
MAEQGAFGGHLLGDDTLDFDWDRRGETGAARQQPPKVKAAYLGLD